MQCQSLHTKEPLHSLQRLALLTSNDALVVPVIEGQTDRAWRLGEEILVYSARCRGGIACRKVLLVSYVCARIWKPTNYYWSFRLIAALKIE